MPKLLSKIVFLLVREREKEEKYNINNKWLLSYQKETESQK